MNRRTRRQSPAQDSPAYLRFLKPGALAKLRDSRISARAQRVDAKPTQISSPVRSSSPPTATQAQIGNVDGPPSSPLFAGRIYGPRCPQRKKLVAVKALYFTGPSTASPSPEPDPIVGFFNSADNNSHNILVAH